jgi:hypothetical protein
MHDDKLVPTLIQRAVDTYTNSIAADHQQLHLGVPFALLRQAATLLSRCCVNDSGCSFERLVAGEFLHRLELRFRGSDDDRIGEALRLAEQQINREFPQIH